MIASVVDGHDIKGVSTAKKAEAALRRSLLSRGANIVNIDRKMLKRLEEEVKRIEMSGGVSEYKLPEAANLSLHAEISDIGIDTFYTPPVKKKDGGYIPASCRYTANVSGVVLMYKVNPVEKLDAINISGSESRLETHVASCRNTSPKRELNLVNTAVSDAMESSKAGVLNLMTDTGYVISAKNDPKGKSVYYHVSLKPSKGAKPGVGVEFLMEFENSLVAFAEGAVACTSHKNAAWVKVSKPDAVSRIKKFTPVRLKYSDGVKGQLQDLRRQIIPCNN